MTRIVHDPDSRLVKSPAEHSKRRGINRGVLQCLTGIIDRFVIIYSELL